MSKHAGARSMSKKILLTLGVLGATAGIAGLGTFASFTSTTSASQTTASGTVVIGLGATGAATNRLTVNASGLVPNDTIQRSFDIDNTGSQNLASITLTSTASPSSLLDSDASLGLQMVIEKCSIAWVETGSSPAFTYTCLGQTSSVVASRAVIGANVAMTNLSSTTAGASDHLRLTLTFPGTATNSLQGLTSTISYAFTGTQRAGTNQ